MRACNVSPCLSLSMFRLPNDSKFHMIPIIRKFGQMTWHKRKKMRWKRLFSNFCINISSFSESSNQMFLLFLLVIIFTSWAFWFIRSQNGIRLLNLWTWWSQHVAPCIQGKAGYVKYCQIGDWLWNPYWLLAWLPFQARRVLIGVDVFRSPISHFDDSTVRDRDREGYWCSSVGMNTPMQVFSWTLAAAVESCAWQQPFCTPSKRPGRKPKSAQSWSNYVRVMEWISLKLTIAVIPLISLWMVLSWPGTSKTDPSQLYSVCWMLSL